MLISVIAWFSFSLKFYLTTGQAINFFSYFTILSNLLVAISTIFYGLAPGSTIGQFFCRLSIQSAVTLYIFIVGLVYNLVLKGIWDPTGWQLVVDNLLHVVVPLLYVIFWLLCSTAGTLEWRTGIYWLLFPLLYLVYSLVRGKLVNWYPYPFLDAGQLGYQQVTVNSLLMLLAFLVVAMLVIGVARFKRRRYQLPAVQESGLPH